MEIWKYGSETGMKMYGPYKLQHTYNVVTVPLEVRKKLGIEPGDMVVWIIDEEGHCVLRKATIKIEYPE